MDVKWLESTVSLGSTQFNFYGVLFSALSLLAGLWVANRLRHLLLARLSQAADLDKSTVYTIATLVFYSVIMVTVLISFSLLGFDITNLAIVAGALSVGIGFGLQDIAKNFISGLLLLFDRSTKVGDFIELTNSGLRGTVEQIRVRSTIVRTADELDVIVPNSQFISDQVVNWTMSSDFLRLHIPFAVAHGTDVARLREAVLSLTSSFQDVVPADREHNASLWFTAIAESSLNFELLVWVKGDATFNAMAKKSEFTYAIHQMLLDQGFRIPIPQRDIYIKSMPEKVG